MLIVDAHQHLGPCRVFDLNQTEGDLLATMDKNGVQAAIVQPFPGAPDPVAIHNAIAEMAKRNPGRIFGLASISPHTDPSVYKAEMARCIKELGFVAIKLHTIGHAVLPLTQDGELVFQTAQELGVPVMVHTGNGIPFACPSLVIPRARQFPDVKIVLAHAGGGTLSGEAMVAAMECPNIYLETSWAAGGDSAGMVKMVGADRVMFGADILNNIAPEIAKYHAVDLNEEQLRAVFAQTAIDLFGLKVGATI